MANRVKVKVPGTKSDGDWCKALTSVDENAESGHDYEGPWVGVGIVTDLEVGTLLVNATHSNSRRTGRTIGSVDLGIVTAKETKDVPGRCTIVWLEASRSKAWAQELRAEARKLLAMSARDRCARAIEDVAARLGDEKAILEKKIAEYGTDEKMAGELAAKQKALAECEARFAAWEAYAETLDAAAPMVLDARAEAVEQIRVLMRAHDISVAEIVGLPA
jgi:hypothetical protein